MLAHLQEIPRFMSWA